MAVTGSPSVRFKDNNKLCTALCKKTPFCSFNSKDDVRLFDKALKTNVKRDIDTIKSRRSRKINGQDRISIKDVLNTQTEWQGAANIRPSATEPFLESKKVPPGKSELRSQILEEERLHGKDRHLSSIFPHPDKRESSALSHFYLPKPALPNDLAPLRSLKRSVGLFTSKQMDSKHAKKPRLSCTGISRRLLIGSSRPSNTRSADEAGYIASPKPRLGTKSREIHSKSYTRDRVLRHNMEYGYKQKGLTETKTRSVGERTSTKNKRPCLELESRHVVDRQTGIRISSDSVRASIYKKPAEGVSCSLRGRSQEDVLATRCGNERSTLVGGKPFSTGKNFHSRTKAICHDGRLQYRLGSSGRESPRLTAMGQGSTKLAYKPKRTVCSFNGTGQISRCVKGTVGYGSVRQPYGCGVYKKSRWNKIIDTAGIDKRIASPSPPSENRPAPFLYPRPVQHDSRLALSWKGSSGLASQQRDYDSHISENGHTCYRFVCDKSVQSSPSLCINTCQGPSSVICERLQQGVAVPVGLDFSTSTSYPQGSTALGSSIGEFSNSCTTMEKRVLEGRPEEEIGGSTVSNLEPGPAFDRSVDQSAPSGNERSIFRGLEGTGWSQLTTGLQSEDITLLRDSTWKTYSSSWKQWTSWCKQQGAKPDRPRPQELASYLSFLFRIKKLAYATILVHKSVIVTLSDPEQVKNLSAHPLVTSMLKAINLRKQASMSPKSKIWNIQDLLAWLETHPPDRESIFQVSRHVALLLLLASGRRVHDLTLLSISPENCIITEKSVTFWPMFGSKTDGTRGRQSGWLLHKSDNGTFDLVSWVRSLIDVTSVRRKSQDDLFNLFITTRGKVKAASRAAIAGWLKTSFNDIGVNCTPGSIRSAVASYDYARDTPLDEILKRGNWKGSTNFFKHYCKTVEKPTRLTKNRLSSSFEAV